MQLFIALYSFDVKKWAFGVCTSRRLANHRLAWGGCVKSVEMDHVPEPQVGVLLIWVGR